MIKFKKKEEKIDRILVCMIHHVCAGEKHPQETHVKDRKDRKISFQNDNFSVDFLQRRKFCHI